MPIVRENAARPIGASPGPARCSEARKIPLQSKMAPSESSTASAMAPKTASRRLGRANRGPRSTPSGRSWSRLGTSAREMTAPMRATPPRWVAGRTPSAATTPASTAPAKAPKEKAAQGAEQALHGRPLDSQSLGVHRDVEGSVGRTDDGDRGQQGKDVDGERGQNHRAEPDRCRCHKRSRTVSSDQRSDGRLGDQQAQGCTEQSKSDGAGTEIEPVLDRGQPRIPGTKAAPLRKKIAVTAVRGPIRRTLRGRDNGVVQSAQRPRQCSRPSKPIRPGKGRGSAPWPLALRTPRGGQGHTRSRCRPDVRGARLSTTGWSPASRAPEPRARYRR